LDYNEQALYSGIYAANHVELAQPYYDFVDSQVSHVMSCQSALAECYVPTPLSFVAASRRRPTGRIGCNGLPKWNSFFGGSDTLVRIFAFSEKVMGGGD